MTLKQEKEVKNFVAIKKDWERLEKIALAKNVSVSHLIRLAIENYLDMFYES